MSRIDGNMVISSVKGIYNSRNLMSRIDKDKAVEEKMQSTIVEI